MPRLSWHQWRQNEDSIVAFCAGCFSLASGNDLRAEQLTGGPAPPRRGVLQLAQSKLSRHLKRRGLTYVGRQTNGLLTNGNCDATRTLGQLARPGKPR